MMADIIAAAVIVFSAYLGYKRGFMKTISKLVCVLLSFIVAKFLYNIVSDIILKSSFAEKIREIIFVKTQSYIPDKSPEFIDKLGGYTADGLTNAAIDIISIIAIIFLTYIISRIIVKALDIVSKAPVISLFNKAGGLIIGALLGVALVYVIISATILIDYNNSSFWLDNSVLASEMYRENIIMNFIVN
ncbi:MAG: CvpA family protein [Clostridia bacterium]|nr:CvpA family protein [Clostridia bacterium]